MSMDNPKARQNELVIQSLDDELLIYDLKMHKAYRLNETSALVWNLCDGGNSVSDIGQQLSRKLKSNISEDFVWLALNELKNNKLLDNSQEINIEFGGLSRREIIRRVGLSSMVALPFITSLAAPRAADAQSGSAAVCTAGPGPGGTQGLGGSCSCAAGSTNGNPCVVAGTACKTGCTCIGGGTCIGGPPCPGDCT